MSFCKFSPNFNSSNKTAIDNVFIEEFLPKAPDLCVKVYIMGLNKCSNADESTNTIKYFAEKLKISEEEVVSIFYYWQEEGLVQVLSTDPVEVRYLPVTSFNKKVKKYDVYKYTDFTIQLQELFQNHMLTQNELNEYIALLENKNIEQSALLEIVKYCINYKGFNLSPNYCLTVARDWIKNGILTKDAVRNKIEEFGIIDDKMGLILSAMGSKRKVQIEDKELLNKWLNSFGFELNVIIFVVKYLKSKKRHLDINVLDEYLTKYFEMKLMSISEIENYENEKENLYFVATAVNKELGIYYEDLTKEIDTYVVTWLNMGFEIELLKMVADNCFKSSIRTLEGYNNIIIKLFKLGITTTNAYMQYLDHNLAIDTKIQQVLSTLNLKRNVNNMDRNFYATWTADWLFPHDVIMYGAELGRDKVNAMQYLNKVLANWNSQGLRTIDKVRDLKLETEPKTEFLHNNYTKEQIASVISNLDEVEV